MKKEMEEAKLTAYLLGELEGPEKEELENKLEQSEELRIELERIRETVEFLNGVFQSEQEVRLHPEQRDRIEACAGSRKRSFRRYYRYAAVAAAACLVVAVYLNWDESLMVEAPEVLESYTGQLEQSVPIQSSEARIDEALTEDDSLETESQVPETADAAVSDRKEPEAVPALVQERSSGRDPLSPKVKASNEAGVVTTETEAPAMHTSGVQQLAAKGNPGQSVAPAAAPSEMAFAKNGQVGVPGRGRAVGVTNRLLTLSSASGMAAGFADLPSAPPDVMPIPPGSFNTEAYDHIDENPFLRVSDQPLSTFSIDADTASYANVRRFLREKTFPPKDAVRIEELINYFSYDYAGPAGDVPFAVHVEIAAAPWNESHQLVRFGLKGKELDLGQREPANLVFLLDVSGSMQPANKLPLLRRAFKLLVEQLDERDKVAIVVYAGASGLVLPPTPCSEKEKIQQAIERLEAGGSTNGGAGIALAYKTVEESFVEGGINRVILATDGDFNVGTTNQGDLTRLIEQKAKSGVFLTVLGFGMGNYKDSTLENLADRGNGNYAYIDTIQEAKKVLVESIGGTLVTIAKDVKIQVEFNPAEIAAYRLIGYENRLLRNRDFNDDQIDAGEIGAGHTVTALYELIPAGQPIEGPAVDPLKYQVERDLSSSAKSTEVLTLKLRYKEPTGSQSKLLEFPVQKTGKSFEQAEQSLRFAAAVAAFGMLLRDSEFKGDSTYEKVMAIAQGSSGVDPGGYRAEFLRLVKRAKALQDLEDLEP
jgi:Ca-activated chloride channel family protein